MSKSKKQLSSFIHNITNEDYATAYQELKNIMFEKTKKRCSEEYKKIKKSK